MGNWRSGRRGGRFTIEGSNIIALDVRHVVRTAKKAGTNLVEISAKAPGASSPFDDLFRSNEIGPIQLLIELDISPGATLGTMTIAAASDPTVRSGIILKATTTPTGGRHWFAQCPTTGLRCAKLYSAADSANFRSREACRLVYRSSRVTRRARAEMRLKKIYRRLNAPDEVGSGCFPMRPKRMRRATYEGLLARIGREMAFGDGAQF